MEDPRPVFEIVRERMPPRLFAIEHEIEAVNRNLFGGVRYPQPTLRALWLEKQKLKKQLMREIREDYPMGIKQPGAIMECVLARYRHHL
jgi:hypothetical protein